MLCLSSLNGALSFFVYACHADIYVVASSVALGKIARHEDY